MSLQVGGRGVASMWFEGRRVASVWCEGRKVWPSAYEDLIAGLSPWGFWPLDETSGGTVADMSGNGRNGSIGSGVTLGVAGPGGRNAARFAGSVGTAQSTTGISIPGMFSLSSAWSVTACVRQSTAGTQSYIVGTNNSLTNGAYWAINNRHGNALLVQSWTGSGSTTFAPSSGPVAPADGEWHHIGVTRSGTSLAFYIDGELSHTATNPSHAVGITAMSIARIRTGGSGGEFYAFSGDMALVAVHSTTVTAEAMAGLAAAAGVG